MEESRKRLIEENLHLVTAMAQKYSGRGIALLDLVQEGNLGLIEAAEKYDPAGEVAFEKYASWRIRHAIVRLFW